MRIFAFIVAYLLFISCHKISDAVKEHFHDVVYSKLSCRLDSVIQGAHDTLHEGNLYTTYGIGRRVETENRIWVSHGAESDFLISDPQGWGYDELGRLITAGEFSGFIEEFREWQRQYGYEGNAKMPRYDTTGSLVGEHFYYEYKYDNKDRIIWVSKLSPNYPEPGPVITEYYYDERGNRQTVGEPLLQYTNRKCLYTVSPSYQLYYRDWSVNTTDTDDIVNDRGYPIKIVGDRKDKIYVMHHGTELFYSCEEPKLRQ